ncbi:MAG TPA: DUF4166 domain-containing protein, partial [Fimbriimonas sp.]|nr:DUF4166 domain-containing protein [Fimbriimonas sp.]
FLGGPSKAITGRSRTMKQSIYATVLGDDFERLHPKIQERFGFNSTDNKRAIGRGVMDRVWHGKFYTIPFLMVGTWRNIMFPEQGENVPFTIENWAYIDSLGRETVTELRTFDLGKKRRFDAYMVRDPERNQVVDYMGTHQHLAVDLHLSVAENGGLRINSGEQRFYAGPIGFKFPMFFSGTASVYVWFDDEIGRYRIEVLVKNKVWGHLFGFVGTFDVEWETVTPEDIPRVIKPKQEESRP